jgi:uncharacterized membrane protein YkvA (DUF1232 family)
MRAGMRSWLSWPSLLRTLVSQARLTLRLLREPRVPLYLKALPVLAVLYVIVPIDVVPDVLPILGQLDDLGLLLVALGAFLKLCPPGAVDFHRTAMTESRRYSPMSPGDEVIDAEFHRENDVR